MIMKIMYKGEQTGSLTVDVAPIAGDIIPWNHPGLNRWYLYDYKIDRVEGLEVHVEPPKPKLIG